MAQNEFLEPIAEHVWQQKYRSQSLREATLEKTWQRVAKAIAFAEPASNRKSVTKDFLEILSDFKFLPAGRILAGAGLSEELTLFNCYVDLVITQESYAAQQCFAPAAATLSQGGGIGFDFSPVPLNAEINGVANAGPGPIGLMQAFNVLSENIKNRGGRRTEMMASLHCSHPAITEFIQIKSDPSMLKNFSLSVLITDDFMKAVAEDAPWECNYASTDPKYYKQVNARELWDAILKNAYQYGEPSVLFVDTINRLNPLWYRETLTATNPGGEVPLPAFGACNLGSINLSQFVVAPFSENPSFNWNAYENVIRIATRFLDNVIDVSCYPYPEQSTESLATRRIGLGFTGLADCLLMQGIGYGTKRAIFFSEEASRRLASATWHASAELAAEKGSFPVYDVEKYLAGTFVLSLPEYTRLAITQNGMRNSHHNAIAPTESISLLANNLSSGIEPIQAAEFTLDTDGHSFEVCDYAARIWQGMGTEQAMPPAWVNSQELSPLQHLLTQASVQRYIDGAIAKHINLAANVSFDEVKEVYTQAFRYSLKGCTLCPTKQDNRFSAQIETPAQARTS